MPVIMQQWEGLIDKELDPTKANSFQRGPEWEADLIRQSEVQRDSLRNSLIEGIIDRPEIRDKQQFVQIIQAMLIRLLDKVHLYKQAAIADEKPFPVHDTISRHLEASLQFIEEFFSNYFDRNERVPVPYFLLAAGELQQQLQLLLKKLSANADIDPGLVAILETNFRQVCQRQHTPVTYNQLVYQRGLMNHLLSEEASASEAGLRNVLYFFNFNNDDFIAYQYRKLGELTANLPTKAEKTAALRFEQKIVNQSQVKLYTQLNPTMPPLKEQVAQWIEEEIRYLQTEQFPAIAGTDDSEGETKIHTALSVAKLALLIRLMVIDKIIVNRVVAQVLRIHVRMITTLQRETISFGSLETKYHNPDKGTINAVKDMLFRWINILNRL